MHCGASLSELHGALVLHRKYLGKRSGPRLWSNVAWICADLGFIVHTVSGSYICWSGIWGGTVGWKMGWNGECS